MELDQLKRLTDSLRAAIGQVVLGQEHIIDLMLTALLSQGHVLLEGVPGTAKTLLVKTFATLLNMQFGRVQLTPDLLPGDLIGASIFDFQTSTFSLTKGPIFTQLLLADELNRTPPKTQAALLEAMQERQVTTPDGTSHQLGPGFMVIATQNPIEQEGTYPLPEAQLDRFLFKVHVDYPERDQERALVRLHGHLTTMPSPESLGLRAVVELDTVLRARQLVQRVKLSNPLIDYIVDLVRSTRNNPALLSGASPRAANMLAAASRAWAAIHGRDYVIPDDVQTLAAPALAHRLVLSPGAQIDGISAPQVLSRALYQLPAPR
jgi:MoxR-like ATPase